jgi:hypothetical protein
LSKEIGADELRQDVQRRLAEAKSRVAHFRTLIEWQRDLMRTMKEKDRGNLTLAEEVLAALLEVQAMNQADVATLRKELAFLNQKSS